MKKRINNIRDITTFGCYHLNSKYWQDYKKSLPQLPKEIFDIAVGMILGDATMYKVSREAYIKFEQGYKQKDFLDTLFTIFSRYTFMKEPGKRSRLSYSAKQSSAPEKEPKSFWFKTFSHESFTKLFHLFYEQSVCNRQIIKRKKIPQGLIYKYLTPVHSYAV